MARVVDPRNLPDPKVYIPGLKPPVFEFMPCDDSDPAEADTFNRMINFVIRIPPPQQSEMKVLLLDTNVF